MKSVISSLVLATGLLLAAPASAEAIYAWVPDDRGGCCRGQIELTDEAYFAGLAAWKNGDQQTTVPVERFFFEGRFTVLDELKRNPENPTLEITVSPVLAAQPVEDRCCEWDIEVRVTPTGGLEGHTRLKTKSDEVALSGESDYWQVDLAKSDVLPSTIICGEEPKGDCANARGRWMLIAAPTAK